MGSGEHSKARITKQKLEVKCGSLEPEAKSTEAAFFDPLQKSVIEFYTFLFIK